MEVGAGGLSLVLGKVVGGRGVVVEHRKEVCREVERVLGMGDGDEGWDGKRGVEVRCVEGVGGKGWVGIGEEGDDEDWEKYKGYLDALVEKNDANEGNENLGEGKRFDKVVLNGKLKLASAITILPYLKPNSIIFFFNFFANLSLYSKVFEYYDEVARVFGYNDPSSSQKHFPIGLYILKPKPQSVGQTIPRNEIHNLYGNTTDSYPMRFIAGEGRWSYLNRTSQNGIDVKAWKQNLVYYFSKQRILLDIMVLIGVFATSRIINLVYSLFFKEVFEISRKKRNAFMSGDIRAGLGGGNEVGEGGGGGGRGEGDLGGSRGGGSAVSAGSGKAD